MYDNNLFIGLLIFATVLAVVGLVLVFLQKKGIVKSFTTVTQSGPDYVGGSVWGNLYRGLYIDPGVGEIKIQNCQEPKINST